MPQKNGTHNILIRGFSPEEKERVDAAAKVSTERNLQKWSRRVILRAARVRRVGARQKSK